MRRVGPGGPCPHCDELVAIHDVFANPEDGGQVPYDLYRAALKSGEYEESGATGSLRLLQRCSAAP